MGAVPDAEEDAEGLERLGREDVAVRQDGVVLGDVSDDPPGLFDILRVAGVVGGDLAFDAGVRGAVDVVGTTVEQGQAAGDQYGAQSLGRGGEIADGAEAAEALAEEGPRGAAGDLAPDDLAVPHDVVGPEVGEVVGLLPGVTARRERLAVDGRGEAGAALVEEEHPEVLQGTPEPCLPADETAGAEAGSAFQIEQPRQVGAGFRGGHGLAAVQLHPLPRRVRVVERDREAVVGESDAGLAVAGQRCSRYVR